MTMSTTRSKRTRRPRGDHAQLRKLLVQRREELLRQMHDELDDSRPDRVGARFDDIADRATDSLYDELAQGFAEIATADIHRIERALEKMDRKTYGTCEICGKPIPQARLRLLPFAELCVACQQEMEEEATGVEIGVDARYRRN